MTDPVRNPPDDSTLVRVRGLTTVLNGKTIFDNLELDIPRGKVTAIMGPSGTGKTTLLKHITGQMTPDAGQILVDGKDVPRLSREALYKLREGIGYLFQNSALLTDFSVFENVAFPLRQHTKLPEVLIRNVVLLKLQAVGLRGAAQLMPNELSGGMARRVALARAIVFDPMLIL
jgi:phospholipid/cholesterol/gamma-HCH transport system ATP-binding protein